MSDTPRTDAFGKVLVSWCGDEERCLEFARQLETELAEARKQLVERDALLERMRKALGGMLTHFGMDEDEWTRPTFNKAREAYALTPSTALAEHDVEVRRKALEEAARLLADDAFAITFQSMGQYRTELLRVNE